VLITELLIDPDAVGDTLGEWLELHNAGDAPVNLAGWSLGTHERSEHVIAAELWLPPTRTSSWRATTMPRPTAAWSPPIATAASVWPTPATASSCVRRTAALWTR
jgi:hypothetical protein